MKTLAVLTLLGSLVTAIAQKEEQPHFDAVAIHRVARSVPVPQWNAGNGGISGGTGLLGLIRFAYGTYDIEKAPSWAVTDFYDVRAKGNSGADEAQLRLMVRSLLEDRFSLRAHWESETRTGLILELDKTAQTRPTPSPPGTTIDGNGSVSRSKTGLKTHGVTMTSFAEFLSVAELQRPVLDRTGLTGGYDFLLSFEDPMRSAQSDAEPSGLPSMFTALKSVGLKLTTGNVAIRVLRIDSVSRPSDN